MSASNETTRATDNNQESSEDKLHSPLKPLLWLIALFAALIAFGALNQ